jgi:hypothetical protein
MNQKITELTELTTVDNADLFEVVDVSDTTMAASGTNKRITKANLLAGTQPIVLDATQNTDHTANGPQTNTLNAGATVAIGEVLYLASDGEWAKADADAVATDGLLAIALAAGTDGNTLLVALPGSFVRDDSWNWTVGGAIYLSTTAGALTQTAPSGEDDVIRRIGFAVSADVLYFLPGDTVTYKA